MTKKQLIALLAPLGAAGYGYRLTPQLGKVVEALVAAGSQELTGVPTKAAPKRAAFATDPAKLPDLLRTLSTPEGSAAYGLLLAPAQGEAAAQLIERFAETD